MLFSLVAACSGDAGTGPGAIDAARAVDSAPPDAGLASCRKLCDTEADCDWMAPLHDGDNFACDDGECVYLGCQADGECSNGTVCRAVFAYPLCVPACDDVSDCAPPTSPDDPLWEQENYRCVDGGCKSLGCLDDDECVQLHGPGWGCLELEHTNACKPRCATTDGCEPAYTCAGGFCQFECTDAYCTDQTPLGPGQYDCR